MGTEKILSVRNSVVDPYTVQIFNGEGQSQSRSIQELHKVSFLNLTRYSHPLAKDYEEKQGKSNSSHCLLSLEEKLREKTPTELDQLK